MRSRGLTRRAALLALPVCLALAPPAGGDEECRPGRRATLYRGMAVVGPGGGVEVAADFDTRVGGQGVGYLMLVRCPRPRPAGSSARAPAVGELSVTLNGALVFEAGEGCLRERLQVALNPVGGPPNDILLSAAGAPGARADVRVFAVRPGPGEPLCNTPPVADAGPDQTLLVGATATLDGSRSTDADGDELTYAWTLASAPPGSLAELSDPSAVNPTLTIDAPGAYSATLVVHDGTAGSTPDTVAISTENSPPVADAGPDQSVELGARVALDGSGSTDVDGDVLAYAWSLTAVPPGSTAALSDPGSVAPSFLADRAGTYVAELVVHDGSLPSAPDTVAVTTLNSAPVADAGLDQTVVAGQTVALDGTGSSDADGDPLSFQWSFTALPPGSMAVLAEATSATPSFTADTPGTYVAQLIVDDGTLASAPDTVSIDTTNSAPVADAGPDQAGVPLQATVTLDGSASSDADGHPLAYSWSLLARPPGSLAVLVGPTAVDPELTPDVVGDYVAQLVVNDGFVDGAPDTVRVSTADAPPVADAGPDQTVAPGATVELDGSASADPEGMPLLYAWALTSRPTGSAAALSDAQAPAPTFVADVQGLYVVELVVSDGAQPSAPDAVAVTAELPLVSVQASDAAAAEPGADPGALTLTRTGTPAGPLTVDFALEGSASYGTDYAATGTSVTFAAGEATVTVAVEPVDDPLVEGDETVVLALVEGAAYDVGVPAAATVTIADNPAPVVTIVAADPDASEAGDIGTFVIGRAGSLAFPLAVSYTVAGTATNGVDYAALSGTLTLPAGAASATITVAPIDDGVFEPVEGVLLQLSAAADYVVGAPGAATVSIEDDDTLVLVVASDPVGAEDGPDPGAYTVSRLGPTTEPLTVFYTLSGTAVPGADYVALPGGVTIPPGASDAVVSVEPIDDELFEGPESAVLSLGAGPGYTVGVPSAASVTIQDDERPAVSVVASDPAASEAGPEPGAFTVSRTGPTDAPLAVLYAVAGSATEGVDYHDLGTSVTIPAGSATATVTVTPVDDSLLEGAESVVLSLSPDPAYVVATPGVASLTIADDDLPVVTVEATDPDASEAGLLTGSFTFSRTGETGAALLVFVSRGGTATNGSDYSSIGGTNFVVTIPTGQSSTALTVSPLADNQVEGDETLVLTISPSLDYVVGTPAAATVTISDDPAVVSVTASDPAAAEAGPDPGAFVLVRSGGNLAAPLTAHFSPGGTAASSADYASMGGSRVIPAGQTAVAVDVVPLADNQVEGDETVVLTVVPPQGVVTYLVGTPATATVTIADDPAVVTASATDPDAAEAGLDPGATTFARSGGNQAAALTVLFTKSGTATNGADYQSLGGAVSLVVIPANQASATVAIDPLADNLVEGPETAILTLAPSAAYAIGGSGSATVTIADDPPVVSVTATDPEAAEAGPDPGAFAFARSGGKLAAPLSVGFTRSGTATHVTDYASIGASVTIPANQSQAAVTIAPVDDALVEGPETVVLAINPASGYVVGTPAVATVTIADDD